MYCTNCGRENSEYAVFCAGCGRRVPQQLICPDCGSPVQSDALFCDHCGYSMQAMNHRVECQPHIQYPASNVVQKTKRVKSKKSAFPLVLLLLISAGVLASLLYYHYAYRSDGSYKIVKTVEEGPSEIVKKYFDAVKYGDVETAISCFTPDIQAEWNAVMSLAGFFSSKATGFGDVSSLLGGLIAYANTTEYSEYEFSIGNVNKSDNTATVTVNIRIDGSSAGSTTINCVKINNKWYITEEAA